MSTTPTTTAAIEVHGLEKTYRGLFQRTGQRALRGLDVTVPRGTAFGLIGPNGAGKTTFIKILLGVVRPSAGTVQVLGGDPEDMEVRARIGYLPERLHLPDAWSPVAFLESVGRMKGVPHDRSVIDALLARVGLSADAGRKIGGFSKGMRQRLGLAGALIGTPELLILDEPTDGIDPLGRVDVRKILIEEVARGATLFLNSHLLAETERVCHRVGILAGGQVVREGALEELRRSSARWRLRFAPGAEEALVAAGFLREEGGAVGAGDRWRSDAADPVALNAALDQARAAGAVLLELAPGARDLEDVLTDAVQAAPTEALKKVAA